MNSDPDVVWMRRALALARRGYTHPNPMVGCVLVRDGAVVGEGWHHWAGRPHAEAEALAAAGEAARGATAYVTLEPCCHTGRTPPCADALIAAGVRRVVAAVGDPNPRVSGGGFERLRAAGVRVDIGALESEARALNEAFFHYHTSGEPLVTLKAAVSLDGKIATRTGDAQWITEPRARSYARRLRGRSGAVLCGIGTVLADNPLLTARLRGAPYEPMRVVLDTSARTPPTSKLVKTAGRSPVLLIAAPSAPAERIDRLERLGVEVIRAECGGDGRPDVRFVLAALAARGVISVLVEGGGTVHAAFLEARRAHRVAWFIAPKLVGGRDAPTAVEGLGAAQMRSAVRIAGAHLRRLGPDVCLEGVIQYP
jgi:diaminohydroxyphosphoribosylaminopyrimidine deaminase/5-amino-6-(5-phosphoribosylamino)uracil reductase